MARHPITLSFLDQTGEVGTSTFYTGPITALTIAAYLTQWGELKSAIDALTIGTLHKETLVIDQTLLSADLPGTNVAQRESKLTVTYKGNTTGKLFQVSIPTADLTKVLYTPGKGDQCRLDAPAEVATFITKFQALCKSPDDDGEGVTVMGIRSTSANS